MYSQNNEEMIIISNLSNITSGKFIEIGAYDPFKFSNTRKLVENGWSGLYVEPATYCFNKFVTEYGLDNEKIKLLNKAIGKYNGKLTFYECDDAISTS
jgi:FkbM family methyltransferase